MNDKDQIKELFSQKLGGYEAKVNPELWANIASQVGTTTAAASTGLSIVAKIIIGVSAASVVTIGAILLTPSDKEVVEKPKTAQVDSQNSNERSEETPKESQITIPNEPQEASHVGNDTHGSEVSALDPQEIKIRPLVLPEEGIIEQDQITPKPSDTPEKPKEAEEETNPVETEKPIESNPESPEVSAAVAQPITIELPNVITPNRDGINDFLELKDLPELKSFRIVVLDQNGTMVYESTDPKFRWNGTNMYTAERLSAGIVYYVVVAEDQKGTTFKKSQNLMIMIE